MHVRYLLAILFLFISSVAHSQIVETIDFCSIYPITVSEKTLADAKQGQSYQYVLNGTGEGNYSWLTWRGKNDSNELETSLVPPGNSNLYINPNNAKDTKLEIGDWVQGVTGAKNSQGIREKMDALLGQDIIVPVWKALRQQGSNRDYHVANFAVIALNNYQLSGKGYISFTFKRFTTCYNKPPVIVSTPITVTPEKQNYQYLVKVEDPNINDVQTFSLDKSPQGMLVGKSSGLIEWIPTAEYVQTTPDFNKQCYVVPSGSVKIYEPGDNTNGNTYIAPLYQRVKEALEKAGVYTAKTSVAWDQSNRCLGCHVQTQAVLSLESSKNKAVIDETAAEYLLNRILTSQKPDGKIIDQPDQTLYNKTATALALWALTYVPDRENPGRERSCIKLFLVS